ncbi:glycosyltransferase family protein [Mangrovivirga cuniculi]|uniref:Glycosyltransferase subfamily 4-like N-terminal domain-containing protein n=1 Tax=Mangrovivirga cuniculi TaxID=2715131 RepID=A0A4D7JSL0_9BACT|nr:glycosyltransferase family 4 protein [Mangrovivirga cuniculi]QCK16490.1 hypothetical protein DCC35_18015 [Mangrovivirga cuniculi]
MNILFISVSAPPKTGAESLQVARFLSEVTKFGNVTLVTSKPLNEGWKKTDASLTHYLKDLNKVIHVHTNLNKYVRFLAGKVDRDFLNRPDADFLFYKKWKSVIKQIDVKPDIIYARASPFSSLLLGLKLKEYFQVPMFSHFSDPFYFNPYSSKNEFRRKAELEIIKKSDLISFTTYLTKEFYSKKYSEYENKFLVIPNVYEDECLQSENEKSLKKDKITISYTGNLYGERNFSSILRALKLIHQNKPDVLKQIKINIAGNIQSEVKKEIELYDFDCINYLGVITQKECEDLNCNSDLLLVIDKKFESEIDKVFLPSKVLDYIVLRKPVLAITSKDSETFNLIQDKYGVALDHDQITKIAEFLIEIVTGDYDLSSLIKKKPPEFYSASYQRGILLQNFQQLVDEKG